MLHYRLFSVPVNAPQDEMRELNKFLSGHRIMQVDKNSGNRWRIQLLCVLHRLR